MVRNHEIIALVDFFHISCISSLRICTIRVIMKP